MANDVKVFPDGRVSFCDQRTPHCPTVKATVDGNVEVGSTLNNQVAVLTRDEFMQLLRDGAGMLDVALTVSGAKPILTFSEA